MSLSTDDPNNSSDAVKKAMESLAVRRRAAMQYRLAGASYRSIAAKLTEDRANAYADANGI